MKNVLKLIFAFTIFLQPNLLWSQQLISSGVPGKYGYISRAYLYVGDRLKIQFSGTTKKMTYLFDGPSITPSADYWANFKKVENIENEEWAITKEGPHEISVSKIKGEGEVKVLRYPAPGKENSPLTYTEYFNYEYVEKHSKNSGFWKSYSKNAVSKSYFIGPPDILLTRKIQDFNLSKGIALYDSTIAIANQLTRYDSDTGDGILNYQRAFRFQKGDTAVFEFTFAKQAKTMILKDIVGENGTYTWVQRADKLAKFYPGQYSSQIYGFLSSDILEVGQSFSGSFIVMNDGVYSFFMHSDATYNLRIVRFPGVGGEANFNPAVEMIPVWQGDEAGYFALEPKLN